MQTPYIVPCAYFIISISLHKGAEHCDLIAQSVGYTNGKTLAKNEKKTYTKAIPLYSPQKLLYSSSNTSVQHIERKNAVHTLFKQ